MNWCVDHWTSLRQRIDDRGLTHLIAKDGHVAAQQLMTELQQGHGSKETFDPLMAAFWAVTGNVAEFLDRAGMNPLYLLGNGELDKCDGRYGPKYEGRPWPRCPVCYINFAHEVSCTDSKCRLEKECGYDWFLDRAADEALARARELKLAGLPS